MRRRAGKSFAFGLACSLAGACASSTSTTLEPPGPSPVPTGTGTIEYVDGGRLYALIVQTNAASAVAASRLEILNVRDFSNAGGRDLGAIDASAIAVDDSADVFVADRTHDQIELDGLTFLTLGAPPNDVAVAGPYGGASGRLFYLGAATAAGIDLLEEDSFAPQPQVVEHVDVGGTARALTFGSLTTVGAAVQGSGAKLVVARFEDGAPAHVASSTPLGDASCPASPDDIAAGVPGYLVWDARCRRVYESGAPAIFGSGGTAGLGSNARLRASSTDDAAVAADGNRLDFLRAGLPAVTVPLPSRATSIAAAADLATVWAALDEAGAARIASVDAFAGSNAATTFVTLPVSGIVRDLEYLDRPATISTSVDPLRVDVCGGPKTVSFGVTVSDADGDPVTLFVTPIPGATFDPSTGTYTATFSKNDGVGSIPLQAVSGRYLVTKNLFVKEPICLDLNFCHCSTTSGGAPRSSAVALLLGGLALLTARRVHGR